MLSQLAWSVFESEYRQSMQKRCCGNKGQM